MQWLRGVYDRSGVQGLVKYASARARRDPGVVPAVAVILTGEIREAWEAGYQVGLSSVVVDERTVVVPEAEA